MPFTIVIQHYLLRHRSFACGIVNLNYDAPFFVIACVCRSSGCCNPRVLVNGSLICVLVSCMNNHDRGFSEKKKKEKKRERESAALLPYRLCVFPARGIFRFCNNILFKRQREWITAETVDTDREKYEMDNVHYVLNVIIEKLTDILFFFFFKKDELRRRSRFQGKIHLNELEISMKIHCEFLQR